MCLLIFVLCVVRVIRRYITYIIARERKRPSATSIGNIIKRQPRNGRKEVNNGKKQLSTSRA